MSSESDIELSSALGKKPKFNPKRTLKSPTEGTLSSEEPTKVNTKVMVHDALTELKTRKGVSLYAIKKYIEVKYNVDIEKNSKYIKKYIKTSVEKGTIIQTKGIGASGSFKLGVVEKKANKKKKPVKIAHEITAKPKETQAAKKKGTEEVIKKATKKEMSKKVTAKKVDGSKKVPTTSNLKEKKTKEVAAVAGEKKKSVQVAKVTKTKQTKSSKAGGKTPKKKIGILKRRSIGSIIKKPKMKPTKA